MGRLGTLEVIYDKEGKLLKKECGYCHEVKPASEFYKTKGNKDGILTICKDCMKVYKKKNKKHIAEYQKGYYQEKKEKFIEYQKKLHKKKKINK